MSEWESVNLDGDECQYIKAAGVFMFKIIEPFWSAGKTFSWTGSSAGLGISKNKLIFCLQNGLSIIRVRVADNPSIYETTTKEWLNFCNETNSKMTRGDTLLYVLQWTKDHFKTLKAGDEYLVPLLPKGVLDRWIQ